MTLLETYPKLTLKEAASILNDNQYRKEGSREIFDTFRKNDIVAVFGYSDDLTEFRGAIHDEWGSGKIFLDENGIIFDECGSDGCPYHKKIVKNARFEIEPLWCDENSEYSWSYRTNITPIEKFSILEMMKNIVRGLFSIRSR